MTSKTSTKAAPKPVKKVAVKKVAAPKAAEVVEPKGATIPLSEEVDNGEDNGVVIPMRGADLLPVPEGKPTNQVEWNVLVIAARAQHKAFERWQANGQPGGRKAAPPTDLLDRLQGYRAEGLTLRSLPEGPKNTTRPSNSKRHLGSVPQGKTAAGLDRMDDAATVAWIQGQPEFATLGNAALHNRFRKAGFGANAKRFARMVEQAKATAPKVTAPKAEPKAKAPAKVAVKGTGAKSAAKTPAAKTAAKPRGRQVAK